MDLLPYIENKDLAGAVRCLDEHNLDTCQTLLLKAGFSIAGSTKKALLSSVQGSLVRSCAAGYLVK